MARQQPINQNKIFDMSVSNARHITSQNQNRTCLYIDTSDDI